MKKKSLPFNHPKRTPIGRYGYTNLLATKFLARHYNKLSCDEVFGQIEQAFSTFIFKHAEKLANISGRSATHQDAYADVLSKIFEFAVEYNPNRLAFGVYLTKKIAAWVWWEQVKLIRRERVFFFPDSIVTDHVDKKRMDDEAVSALEQKEKIKIFNSYEEATSDMLLMRHILGLTQQEIGKIFGIHQYTVSLHLRSAYSTVLSTTMLRQE